MTVLDNNMYNLKKLLERNIFNIPKYQRGYSWEKAQLEDFWEDLTMLMNNTEVSRHFIGMIVVHQESSGKKNIIDGQQRLSTAVILLDAVRSSFIKINNEKNNQDAVNFSNDITKEYIGRVTTRENDPRLIMGEVNNIFFREYIQKIEKNSYPIKSLSKSDKRIYDASKFFNKRLEELIEDEIDLDIKIDTLKEVYETFLKNFELMYLETDDINEAFIIFETLNARGKELDTSDLLKNHVFRQSGDRFSSVEKQWNNIFEALGSLDATKFIRYFWNATNSFTRTRTLYKTIRTEISNERKVEKLVNELSAVSDVYAAILDPDNNLYFKDYQLNEKIKYLSVLNVNSFVPIILSMVMKGYLEKDVLLALKAIESLIVRNLITAGLNPNKFELYFASIAHDIYKDKYDSLNEVILEINEMKISDEDFKTYFEKLSLKQSHKARQRYFLRMLDAYDNDETRIIDNNDEIHIEHILPLKGGKWSIDEDVHSEYVNRLGNLTLLGQEYNKEISNNTFDYKKSRYKDSKIGMTLELLEHDTWTAKDIETRQKKMANLALKIW